MKYAKIKFADAVTSVLLPLKRMERCIFQVCSLLFCIPYRPCVALLQTQLKANKHNLCDAVLRHKPTLFSLVFLLILITFRNVSNNSYMCTDMIHVSVT